VIIDTGLTLDNVLMAILDGTDSAWVVTQGTVPAVGACARLLPTLEGLGLPASRTRVIVNAPQPSFSGELRPVDVADRLQRTVDHVVPYDRRVGVSMNTGIPPIVSAHRWQRLGRAITGISESISAAGTMSMEADTARGRR
jgi:pilus assembly protein CpaE